MDVALPHWVFKKTDPDDTQRDSVTGEFFKSTRLESVIREGIQHSLDARSGAAPADVRIYYSGAEAAVDGHAYAANFRGEIADAHYTNEQSGLANVPAVDEHCEFMTIEDFNTTGLTGSLDTCPTQEELENDRKKGNYYNFFFKENRSDKNGAGSLGSWGSGKIMFMQASRLMTSFTFSSRENETVPRFVAGRTVLMSRTIDGDMFGPDGWFGTEAPMENPPQRYMRKRPVTDETRIEEFCKMFRLERSSEPGTSVVIPYLNLENENGDGEFTRENIVRAVLKNFMIAIIGGNLKVTIKTVLDDAEIVLDSESIKKEKKYLPDEPDNRSNIVTRLHYSLAAKSMADDFPEGQAYMLKHIAPGSRSQWCDAMFEDLNLKAIKKQIASGKCVRFIVPMTIQARSETNRSEPKYVKDTFSVSILSVDEAVSYRTAFYRKGLLIDSASKKSFVRYVSLVLIDGENLAKCLVASEPPSHGSWDYTAKRIKENYFAPSAHISFVTSAVGEILNRIESADKDPDWCPLIGSFSIPKEVDDEPKKTKKPTPKKPDQDEPDAPEPPEDPKPIPEGLPEELLHLAKLQSKTGFTISVKPDRVAEKGYPFKAFYKMGYAPFNKTKWSPNDFDLKDSATIAIALEDPAQSEIVEFSGDGNKLVVRVKKQGAFRLSVTGFDPNRDLEITRQRYDYSEANPPAESGEAMTEEEV